MTVLDLCTGMGLFARAFLDLGFSVTAGCEIDPKMRNLHQQLNGSEPLVNDLLDLCPTEKYEGIIGGPPCQSISRLKSFRVPKFPDLTEVVQHLIDIVNPEWYILENVGPLAIRGAQHIRMNAMHYYRPHQSRARYFTYSPNLNPPKPRFEGTVDSLRAYPCVCGLTYGPKRAAWLQGLDEERLAALEAPCKDIQLGLANAVPYPLGVKWAQEVRRWRTRVGKDTYKL